MTIAGVLTTRLGALESGRGGFVQDATGGIALYLDAAVVGDLAGRHGRHASTGTVDSRFAQRTLRLRRRPGRRPARAAPGAVEVATGAASEAAKGRGSGSPGPSIGSPDQLSDGLGVTIDDGTGPVRAVIGPDALAGSTPRVRDRMSS